VNPKILTRMEGFYSGLKTAPNSEQKRKFEIDIVDIVSKIPFLRIAPHTARFFDTGSPGTRACGVKNSVSADYAPHSQVFWHRSPGNRACGVKNSVSADYAPHSQVFWHRSPGNRVRSVRN